MNNPIDTVVTNWHRIVEEVAEAAIQASRAPAEIVIVGVTKYVDLETTSALIQAGCSELGESRPQSLWEKAAALQHATDRAPRWHMIGHLQRNKVRRSLPWISLLHSLDSLRLAEAISEEAVKQESQVDSLLEVNISDEVAKGGFAASQVAEALEVIGRLPGLRIRGLMGMASLQEDSAAGKAGVRRQFARLRTLRDELASRGLPESIELTELSMGMSGDFAEAIAEGATLVRIGSRLFDGL